MGLEIQFIDTTGPARQQVTRFRLVETDGTWIAPEVNLVPVHDLPLVSKFDVTVTGTPAVVASRLSAAYYSKAFDKPVPVASAKAIGSGRLADANPLPAESQCELRVRVQYFDATPDGKPTGAAKTATAVCLLYSGGPPDRPPVLTARAPELSLLIGQATGQSVEVRDPTEAAPKAELVFPDTLVAPDDPTAGRFADAVAPLTAALVAALSRPPARNDADPTRHEFRWPLDLRLPEAAKAALEAVGEPVSIPVAVSYPGAKPVRWLLHIEVASRVFPGWVVIDFGTTNSTVTVHDTWDLLPFDGLPEEQEKHLQAAVVGWLKADAGTAFGKRGKALEGEWLQLKTQVAGLLFNGSADGLAAWVGGSPGRLHQLLATFETSLRLRTQPLRRVAGARLARAYRDALRVPSLRRYQLFPLKLDPDTRQETVASELEVVSIATRGEDNWPDVKMGRSAQQGRLKAIGAGDVPLEHVLQRFHPSPKRYFGTDHKDFDIELDGRLHAVSVQQLMRAGWGQLLKFADLARRDEPRFSAGPMRRAVITYPTVAPPSVRQTIQKLLKDLRVADVRTDYDEAVASAIFYIMREYNALPELGLESFKARSRIRGDGSWAQNVLVFDIGGGTTDVALLRLTLTEEPVFGPGEDRGAGGRYYKLTPQLLSSSGHMQLGGELMTLRLFRLLKAMIADKLLTLVQQGKLTCDPVKTVLNGELPEGAAEKGQYVGGWLREVVQKSNPDANEPRLRDALRLMERVFPTKWSDAADGRAARLQSFYALWQYAEDAKKKLGGKLPGEHANAVRDPYILSQDKLIELFEQAELPVTVGGGKGALEVRLIAEDMDDSAEKVVREAVKIAEGALERLPAGETLDWLILSGQSCNLTLVDRELRKAFKASNRFVWNPERVTFLPEYAKLSTAIGACYAENQRRNRFAAKDSKGDLRRGINVLYFDINNLFSYLPCSFVIPDIDSTVLAAGQELFDLAGVDDPDQQRGLARSGWLGAALNVKLYRQDYKGGTQRPWGTFDGQAIVNQLTRDVGAGAMSENRWREQVRLQFEIDHRLNVDVLLYRAADGATAGPRYQVTGGETRLNLTDAMAKAAERVAARAPAPGAAAKPPAPLPPLFDAAGKLQWKVGVGTATGVTRTLFDADPTAIQLHDINPTLPPGRAVLSQGTVDEFTDDLTVVVWGTPPGVAGWVPLGVLHRPGETPMFRRHYRATLDEYGLLRLHNGEPRYLESGDPRCLAEQPGVVFRTPLTAALRETDEDRNPFTGRH